MKLRACAVCSVSFQSVRRDALYCSPGCRQKAHRTGKAQLFPIAAHVDERGALPSATRTQATLGIEVQADAAAGLDPRLGQIDALIGEAAKRGRTAAALSAMDGQRKARPALARRRRDASTLADVEDERATLGATRRQIEADTAAVHHVVEPIGAGTDSERAIRWLLALIMLCCDPPAGALTAAASPRNRSQGVTALPKIMGDVLQVAD